MLLQANLFDNQIICIWHNRYWNFLNIFDVKKQKYWIKNASKEIKSFVGTFEMMDVCGGRISSFIGSYSYFILAIIEEYHKHEQVFCKIKQK